MKPTIKKQTTIEPLGLAAWLDSGRLDLYHAPVLPWPWRLALALDFGIWPIAWFPEMSGSIVALTEHRDSDRIACYRISRDPQPRSL